MSDFTKRKYNDGSSPTKRVGRPLYAWKWKDIRGIIEESIRLEKHDVQMWLLQGTCCAHGGAKKLKQAGRYGKIVEVMVTEVK